MKSLKTAHERSKTGVLAKIALQNSGAICRISGVIFRKQNSHLANFGRNLQNFGCILQNFVCNLSKRNLQFLKTKFSLFRKTQIIAPYRLKIFQMKRDT